MIRSNAALLLKYVAVDVVGSFLYFPVWWYTRGLVRAGAYCLRTIADMARSYGVSVWIKNLFTPMFGQHDISGRLISFFMRLVMIVWYSFILLILSVLMLAVFALWVVLPLFIASQFFGQLSAIMRSF